MLPDPKNLKIAFLCMLRDQEGGVKVKSKNWAWKIKGKEANLKNKWIQNL